MIRSITPADGAPRIVIDVAGAAVGGSGRFLAELESYLAESGLEGMVQVVGRDRRLTSTWLIQRERHARRAPVRIALNNASFIASGGRNIVLLRNVLHFSSRSEFQENNFVPAVSLRAQVPVIRNAARRAHRIVVPTNAMAARVTLHEPALAPALQVRGHPVTQRPWAGMPGSDEVGILVPVVPSPYKHLEDHVVNLVHATEDPTIPPTRITVTASAGEMPRIAAHPRINFIGRVPSGRLDRYWRDSLAVYYPTTYEAFGYPLAEARVNGRYVIAQATAQNLEVAGASLCPFAPQTPGSLVDAVRRAISGTPPPDSRTNDPGEYFRWLFGDALDAT